MHSKIRELPWIAITDFLGANDQVALALTKQTLKDVVNYKSLLRAHYPRLYHRLQAQIGQQQAGNEAKSVAIDYKQIFIGINMQLSPLPKKLFRLFREGLIEEIKQEAISFKELYLENGEGNTLLDEAASNGHQAVCDYCYQEILVPFWNENDRMCFVLYRTEIETNNDNYFQFHKDHYSHFDNLLHWAIKCRQPLETIKKISEAHREYLDKIGYDGFTTLAIASLTGQLEVVDALLCHSRISPLPGEAEQPLTAAARRGHLDVVRYLAAQGAHIDKHNKDDETALYVATKEAQLPIVNYLIEEKNANILTICHGQTPLDLAKGLNYPDIVAYLTAAESKPATTSLPAPPPSANLPSQPMPTDCSFLRDKEPQDGQIEALKRREKIMTNIYTSLVQTEHNKTLSNNLHFKMFCGVAATLGGTAILIFLGKKIGIGRNVRTLALAGGLAFFHCIDLAVKQYHEQKPSNPGP